MSCPFDENSDVIDLTETESSPNADTNADTAFRRPPVVTVEKPLQEQRNDANVLATTPQATSKSVTSTTKSGMVYHELSDIRRNIELERLKKKTIRDMRIGSGSGFMLEKMDQYLRWYERKFGKKIDDELDPNTIFANLYDWIDELEEAGGSSGRSVSTMLACFHRSLLLKGHVAAFHINEIRKTYHRSGEKQSRVQRVNGEYLGTVAYTRHDMRHVMNDVIKNHSPGGIIPLVDLQVFVQMVIQRTTSCRVVESHFISAADWKIHFKRERDPNNPSKERIALREMSFAFGWQKMFGPAPKHKLVRESREGLTEDNVVALVLVFMERRGMITSAADVYQGKAPLKIDASQWETVEDTVAALKLAKDQLFDRNLCRVVGDHDEYLFGRQKDDPEYQSRKASALEDDVKAKSFYRLAAEARKKHGKKVFFCSYDRNGMPKKEGQTYEQRQDRYRSIHQRAGYTNSKSMMLGGTQQRKGFFNNTGKTQNNGMSDDTLLDCHGLNGRGVRLKSYIDQEQIRQAVPSNLLQDGVARHPDDDGQGVFINPAYTRRGYFDKENFTPITEALPVSTDFIAQQLPNTKALPVSDDATRSRAVSGPSIMCIMVGCNRSLEDISHFMKHLNQECQFAGSPKEAATCHCGVMFEVKDFHTRPVKKRIMDHYRSNKCHYLKEHYPEWMFRPRKKNWVPNCAIASGRVTAEVEPKPYVCDECGFSYVLRKKLNEHWKKSKSCKKSAAYDPRACRGKRRASEDMEEPPLDKKARSVP